MAISTDANQELAKDIRVLELAQKFVAISRDHLREISRSDFHSTRNEAIDAMEIAKTLLHQMWVF